MPHWVFSKDEGGTYHKAKQYFSSEAMAQRFIDEKLSEQDCPEVFYSPHYDSAKVTQEWKFKRIEREGLDKGTKRIRHDK